MSTPTTEESTAMLKDWQRHRFRQDHLPFTSAAKLLQPQTNARLDAIPISPSMWMVRSDSIYEILGRWLIYNIQMHDRKTGDQATFTFAIKWMYSLNLETGSYVPDDEELPRNVRSWGKWVIFWKTFNAILILLCRNNNMDSPKCAMTYDFDAKGDNSIFSIISVSRCMPQVCHF